MSGSPQRDPTAGDRGDSRPPPESRRAMDARIREYWDWIAIGLFLFTTVDMLTTVFAARVVGVGAEANPLIEWTLTHGAGAFAAVNLLALLLIVGLFWGVVRMLERTPAPYDRYFAVAIELWIGGVLTIGFLIFANNLAVIFFQESLL
ncbi:MAG: hypothetical protein ABEH66_02640 [Halobacteriales archaeon]